MELDERKIWRIIYIICFSLSIIAGLFNLVCPKPALNREIVAGSAVGIADLILAALFFLLFLKPDRRQLFAGICFFVGFTNIMDAGDIVGILFYILCWSILLKEGFYRDHIVAKVILSAVSLIIPLGLKLRFGFERFMSSVLNIALIVTVFIFLFIIFRQYLITLLPATREKPVVNLDDYELMQRDYDFIRRVRDNEKYSAIAIDYNISESAIKQRMVTIYRKLGVADRSEFLVFCNTVELVFPKAP
jgi:hypothetical protein